MQLELQPGDHAEIAATPAQGPEQFGVVGFIGEQQLAVSSDELDGEQRVDREAVFAGEIADATTEGDAADPDGAGVAEADDEVVRGERLAKLDGGDARADPDRAVGGVDVDLVEIADIDHEAALRGGVAGAAVAAAADRELEAAVPGVGDGGGNVLGIGDADDGAGALVITAVHDGAELVVVGIGLSDDPASGSGGQAWGIRVRREGHKIDLRFSGWRAGLR